MAPPKYRHKRGASGDKGGYNPINKRPPAEFLCLVGGTSNPWNGYLYWDSAASEWKASPKVPITTKNEEIAGYMLGPRGADGKPKYRVFTHDRYWGNFIDAAIRLYLNRLVRLQPGDVITFLIFFPAYVGRNNIDWEASPYHLQHLHSPWVRGKSPFFGDPFKGIKRVHGPPKSVSGLPRGRAQRKGPIRYRYESASIDHEILMRETSANEPDRRIIKRPESPTDYLNHIHDIPKRIVYGNSLGGTPQLKDVLVKILLFDDWSDAQIYITQGKWRKGKRWKHLLDTRDEADMAQRARWPKANYDYSLRLTKRRRRLWRRLWRPSWLRAPDVNRKRVKIIRFDYFGHSDADNLIIDYGRNNEKGELPDAKLEVPKFEFETIWKRQYFRRDAEAKLWGCYQGSAGEMADTMKVFFKELVACPGYVTYEDILKNDTNMPVPEKGQKWKTFKR